MSDVYKFRLFCIEEDDYVYEWAEEEPTLCPNDHSDKTIDSSKTIIVETRSETKFKAEENTEGDFTTKMFENSIPSGTPGNITHHDDAKWDFDILLWKNVIYPTADNIGDVVNVRGIANEAPNYNIAGGLTATANIGDTILNVASTVTDNLYKGLEIELVSGSTKENVGLITAIDKTVGSETITVAKPLTISFPPGSYVKYEVVVMEDIRIITDKYPIIIGGKGMKGKNISAGDIMRVKYTNNDGAAKTLYLRPEYYNKDSA